MKNSEQLLSKKECVPVCKVFKGEKEITNIPGIYAIFVSVKGAAMLRPPFDKILTEKNTQLIYIGMASKNLKKRLGKQDLKHKGSSTFFRSLGAILGKVPDKGSLKNRKNKNNYKFSDKCTSDIIEYINNYVSISWIKMDAKGIKGCEKQMILKHRPLLNIQNNPDKCQELIRLREKCREIARS